MQLVTGVRRGSGGAQVASPIQNVAQKYESIDTDSDKCGSRFAGALDQRPGSNSAPGPNSNSTADSETIAESRAVSSSDPSPSSRSDPSASPHSRWNAATRYSSDF